MKAFLSACVAMFVIGVVAWAALEGLGTSSKVANTSTSGSVRLD